MPSPDDQDARRRAAFNARQPDGPVMMGVLAVAMVVAGVIRLSQSVGRPYWYFILAILPVAIAVGLRVTGTLLVRRLAPMPPLLDDVARRREPRRIIAEILLFSCMFGAWVINEVAGEPTGWALLVLFVGFVPGALYIVDTFRMRAALPTLDPRRRA